MKRLIDYLMFGVIILLIILIIKSIYSDIKIDKEGKSIVVKLINIKKGPKTTGFYFSYYSNNKKITTSNCGIDKSIFNSKKETEIINDLEIGAFYIAKYLLENPEQIKVDPNYKITDTIAILKAGFTTEDLSDND